MPSRSVLRWILVEDPFWERPSACVGCPRAPPRPKPGPARPRNRISTQGVAVSLRSAKASKNASNTPIATSARTVPHRTPRPVVGWQKPLHHAVDGEMIKRFQKLAIVASVVTPAVAHRTTYPDSGIPNPPPSSRSIWPISIRTGPYGSTIRDHRKSPYLNRLKSVYSAIRPTSISATDRLDPFELPRQEVLGTDHKLKHALAQFQPDRIRVRQLQQ